MFLIEGSDASGLYIMDIGDPANPTPIRRMDLPGASSRIVIRDDLAFVSSAGAGVLIGAGARAPAPNLLGAAPGMVADLYVEFAGGCVVAALVIMIALYWFTETFNIPLAGS